MDDTICRSDDNTVYCTLFMATPWWLPPQALVIFESAEDALAWHRNLHSADVSAGIMAIL